MKFVLIFVTFLLTSAMAFAQESRDNIISFRTEDNGTIYATLYGSGKNGVVLAHGAAFNMESWHPLAIKIRALGMSVLAIDFRGYGKSKAGTNENGLYEDVLGAIQYLKSHGAQNVSVLGASMGGGASAEAAVKSKEKVINKLILLSPVPIRNPSGMKYNKVLYLASKDEPLRHIIESQFKESPKPKQIRLFDGSAHAQNIFKTNRSDSLTNTIINFLKND